MVLAASFGQTIISGVVGGLVGGFFALLVGRQTDRFARGRERRAEAKEVRDSAARLLVEVGTFLDRNLPRRPLLLGESATESRIGSKEEEQVLEASDQLWPPLRDRLMELVGRLPLDPEATKLDELTLELVNSVHRTLVNLVQTLLNVREPAVAKVAQDEATRYHTRAEELVVELTVRFRDYGRR